MKKSLCLIVVLVLIMLFGFTACSSENNVTDMENSCFESTSVLSGNKNNTSSSQIETSSRIKVSSKTTQPTTSMVSNISSLTDSKKLKILKIDIN